MAKKRRYKTKAKASKIDIAVITLIIVSILLAVLIYTKSGVVGLKLNEILGGMFGLIPLTGVGLPFMSYGGSFTICLIASLTFVQRVSIENGLTNEKEKSH